MASLRKPRQGTVVARPPRNLQRPGVDKPNAARDKIDPRPDPVINGEAGLLMRLKRIPGVTRPRLLPTPYFFQVPPLEQFTVEESFDYSEFATIGQGTFSRPSAHGLRTVSFDTIMLQYDPLWASYAVQNSDDDAPEVRIEGLRKVLTSGTPVHLFVGVVSSAVPANVGFSGVAYYLARQRANISMKATMRALTVTEKAGEPDSFYITASFTEWRDPVDLARSKLGVKGAKRPGPESQTRYVTVDGDGKVTGLKGVKAPATLVKLSKAAYGAGEEWKVIAKANPLLKNWAGNRSLAEFVNEKNKKKPIKLKIPAVQYAGTKGPRETPTFGELA